MDASNRINADWLTGTLWCAACRALLCRLPEIRLRVGFVGVFTFCLFLFDSCCKKERRVWQVAERLVDDEPMIRFGLMKRRLQ